MTTCARGTALFCILVAAALASATTINSAAISGTQITITGNGFAGPLKVSFNGVSIPIVSSTATQIIATLNPVPPPGSYRLMVKVGQTSTYSYVAVSAAANIVAQVALTGQVESISPTTIFTPQVDGTYRLSVYLVITTNNQDGLPGPAIFSWTDDAGPQPPIQIIFNSQKTPWTSNGGSAFYTFPVRANAGTPIQFCVIASNTNPDTYEVFVTVEQLQ